MLLLFFLITFVTVLLLGVTIVSLIHRQSPIAILAEIFSRKIPETTDR